MQYQRQIFKKAPVEKTGLTDIEAGWMQVGSTRGQFHEKEDDNELVGAHTSRRRTKTFARSVRRR